MNSLLIKINALYGITFAILLTLVIRGFVAQARGQTFPAIHLHIGTTGYWRMTGYDTAYKNDRLREYQDMLKARGITDSGKIRLFVAQLIQEDGALAETKLGDHGCSFGILQYNACAHNHMSATRFLQTHPAWRDYHYQLTVMADEVADNMKTFGTARCTIVWHNGPAYAMPCTSRTDTKAHYFQKISRLASSLSI